MSKFMSKIDALEKKKASLEQQKQAELEELAKKEEPSKKLEPANVTQLVFFKKYDTYQALLEVFPSENLSAEECFSKVILYIMTWFKKRLGEDVYEKYPDIAFLKSEYPMPDDYPSFSVEKTERIEGLNFIDLEVSYHPSSKSWLFSLEEPDNGREKKNIQGRIFKTEVSVYQKESSVIIGVRGSCREPQTNEEDAFGFRPGFIRDFFLDPDLKIGEQGLKEEYAFLEKPILVNGKSSEACEKIYNELIASNYRQMPVLFIPGDYYESNKDEVDEKTASLLGYCHVLIWQNTCRKLFSQIMKNEEFAEVAEEGQLIFYRTNYLNEYTSSYYEADTEDLLSIIKSTAQHEPIRKTCDFRGFSFDSPHINGDLTVELDKSFSAEERLKSYGIAMLKQEVGNLKRDNDILQRKNDELLSENKKLDKTIAKDFNEILRLQGEIDSFTSQLSELKKRNQKLEATQLQQDVMLRGFLQAEKERILPLLHMPAFDKDKKENILSWIEEYYSETIVVHPNAKKSFEDDERNIDYHRLCMMIHYLAGYTKYRNNGGPVINPAAAREYDPEEYAFTVSPVNSGTGTIDMYKDKYTIRIPGKNGKDEEVLLDLHIKTGKGRDANMLRVYFYYSTPLKKSFIGYMPEHLPTRKDGH